MKDTPLQLLARVLSPLNTKATFSLKHLHAQTKGGTLQLPLQGEIHNCLFDTEIVSQWQPDNNSVLCMFSGEQWCGTCLSQTCKNHHLNRHLYTPSRILMQGQFVVCACSDSFIEVTPHPCCALITELWQFPVNNSTVPLCFIYTYLCIEISLRLTWQNICLIVELSLMETHG